MTRAISVIIPTLNEAKQLPRTLANVRAALPDAEIIIADGGSADGTLHLALPAGTLLLLTAPGRGQQLATGAALAQGRLLLFLHADTTLPANAAAVLSRAFANDQTLIGSFRLRFDGGGWFLRACAWFTRFDSVFTRFGDQGIVIRRDFYATLGGFPQWPLFEDVELLRRARRLTRVHSFPAAVTTSARRFHRQGPLRRQFRNAGLLLRFLFGTPPEQLSAEYRPEPVPPARARSLLS
ncbi:MAG: TIGR04283 family arsenosugar biosynthesis glycosyltransferase [Opitutae bacterium]|nr:TIGR04283 family arsenosugar biosynthesis glycosyltransferase [Opitutae bacterium]